MRNTILVAKVNTYIGGLFILSFGVFALTIGFKIVHMENPIANALTAEQQALGN